MWSPCAAVVCPDPPESEWPASEKLSVHYFLHVGKSSFSLVRDFDPVHRKEEKDAPPHAHWTRFSNFPFVYTHPCADPPHDSITYG